jgi:integrase/recombinase XerD
MASKVNLKKYIAVDGKWRFVPVLKVDDRPQPGVVLIDGVPKKGTEGTFYLEWRENGKRIQKPCGATSREALDAWRERTAILEGTIEQPEPEIESISPAHISVADACKTYLAQVKARGKSKATLAAYARDLEWFQQHLRRKVVGLVTRQDLIDLLGQGIEQGRSDQTRRRAVQVGVAALRESGAAIQMKKGDWPRKKEVNVEIYSPDEIKEFLEACTPEERLVFLTFLLTGFREQEAATLRWQDINFHARTIQVSDRPEYGFKPKNHEKRAVPVPNRLIDELRKRRRSVKGALVFPSPKHPTRPDYGGDQPNMHFLDWCKNIAYRAGLNCRHCVAERINQAKKGREKKRIYRCADGPHCERWYLHKWRHTYATSQLRDGVDIRTLQTLLGHKTLEVTMVYLKALGPELLQDKMEQSSLAAYF